MKTVKWRKSNPYFKSLEAEQSKRLSKCGEANREWYDSPTIEGTMFSQQDKYDWEKFKQFHKRQMI